MATTEEYEQALLAAAEEAVSRYAPAVATFSVGRNERDSTVWGFEITPRESAAASVYCAYAGSDEVDLGFGRCHVYLWHGEPDKLADLVKSYLEPVLAGRFIEAGRMRGSAFARVTSADGKTWGAGSVHFPLLWRCRRLRRYSPCDGGR